MKTLSLSFITLGLTALPLLMPGAAHAQVTFSNGLPTTTVGYARADVSRGGYYTDMHLTPTGFSAPIKVGYEVGLAYSVNGGAWAILPGSNGLSPTTSGNQLLSNGSLTGANGAVNWNATTRWVGSSLQTTYGFTSTSAFGDLRLAHYVDNDIDGPSDDLLVVKGSVAGGDLDLRTYDNTGDFGLGTLPNFAATNLTYLGWSAGLYSGDLESSTMGRLNQTAGASLGTFTLGGSVNGIATQNDARFVGSPNYGYGDIIIGQFYSFRSGATIGELTTETTGLQNLDQGSGGSGSTAPEPGTLAFLALGGGLVIVKRRRK